MRVLHSEALSFSDVILVPQYSEVSSRLATTLTTRVTKRYLVSHPVVATNMSTVTGERMALEMARLGSFGILHRFQSAEDIAKALKAIHHKEYFPAVMSIGVKDEDYQTWHDVLSVTMPDIVLIDIAHGDSLSVYRMLDHLKKYYAGVDVAVGNIATKAAAQRLIDAGADAIRVGIGGGSVCSTRNVTGHGMPTLQSIIDCEEICRKHHVPIWADGGFRTPGDIVKALAAGASCVTLGGMLAGTSESEGDWEYYYKSDLMVIGSPDGKRKRFYGMSSKEAQEIHRDGLKTGIAAEGIEKYIDYEGTTEEVVTTILGGIRSGLTYSGARNIQELQDKAVFSILAPGSIKESKY